MQIQPNGAKYEVVLRGEAIVGDRSEPIAMPTTLLCNKQYIAWGGVSVGRAL